MRWHSAPVLANQHSARVRSDSQDVVIRQSLKSRLGCGSHVNFWCGPPQSSKDTPIQVGVSLESDLHRALVAALQSTLRLFASIARRATQRCAVLQQGISRSLSGSLNRKQALHAPAPKSMLGNTPPCSPPTSLRERGTRANPERPAYRRPDIRLRSSSRILFA